MSLVGMRWVDNLRARTVVVNTTNGESLRGLLVGVYRDCLVLKHAVHLGTIDGQRLEVPVDGEAVIPRERVGWIQTLPSGEG